MITTSITRSLVVVAIAASIGIAARVSAQSIPPTIAGDWTATYDNGASARVSLKVDGTVVSGTYNGDAVKGEFVGGTLTFGGPDDWAAWKAHAIGSAEAKTMYQTLHTATLDADGRLHGTSDTYVRGNDMAKRTTWTAARVTIR